MTPARDALWKLFAAPRARLIVGLLFAVLATFEFSLLVWTALSSPGADAELSPLDAGRASTRLLIGMLAACAAVWRLEPFSSPLTQARISRVCRWLALAAVALGIVPLVHPFFLPEFQGGHDAPAHQTYVFLFMRALESGQWPVRWVEGIADGLGQPLFNHYQVGFYYLVALIYWCGTSLSLAFKLTAAAQWGAVAGFMFLLCRPLGTMPAAMAAAVVMWSPYLLLDAYVRNAYPELAAIGFAPGVLWSIDRVLRTGRPVFVCSLALTTGLLLISHLPTALIIAPIAAACVAGLCIVHRPDAKAVGLVGLGAGLGVGLAAFYLLPAILELGTIKIGNLIRGGFDYHAHFVAPERWFDWSWGYGTSGTGVDDELSMQIGVVQWAVLAGAVIVLASSRLRHRTAAAPAMIAGCLAIVAGSLFLMTSASVRVWETIAPLTFIQFPWRLLMVPVLACGVLAATLLSAISHPTRQALLVLCVVAIQWHVTQPYRAMAAAREREPIRLDLPFWRIPGDGKWAFREAAYDPVTVQGDARPASGRWTIPEDKGEVIRASVSDDRLDLDVRAEEPVKLVINSPFVPGWRIAVDGHRVFPSIQSPSGYMEIQVAAGAHRVEAVFADTRLRAVAELITLISVLVLLAVASSPAWRLVRHSRSALDTIKSWSASLRSRP